MFLSFGVAKDPILPSCRLIFKCCIHKALCYKTLVAPMTEAHTLFYIPHWLYGYFLLIFAGLDFDGK